MGMSVRSMGTFTDHDGYFLNDTASKESGRQRLADGLALKMRLNILKLSDGTASQRNKNVANDDARTLRRAIRFDIQNDCRGFFVALERVAERLGQTNQ